MNISISNVILAEVESYSAKGIDTYAIGNGYCNEFAESVLSKLDSDIFYTVETFNFVNQTDSVEWDHSLLSQHWNIFNSIEFNHILDDVGPHHVWITDGILHYDAETPNGVKSFFLLPFFIRHIQYTG